MEHPHLFLGKYHQNSVDFRAATLEGAVSFTELEKEKIAGSNTKPKNDILNPNTWGFWKMMFFFERG